MFNVKRIWIFTQKIIEIPLETKFGFLRQKYKIR